MPTRNVVLTDHQDEMISAWVEAGRYQNASEVLREGLRMVEQREAAFAAKFEALRAAVNIGLTDVEAGRYDDVAEDDLDACFDRLDGHTPAPQTP